VFVQQFFTRPTWCDYCTHFVNSVLGKQGYRCSNCGYTVHNHCFARVRFRLCLVAKPVGGSGGTPTRDALRGSSDEEIVTPTTHIHRFRLCNFHKPRWCPTCNSALTAIPYGKKGYQCVDCKTPVHKECIPKLRVAIVLKEDQSQS
jgi:tRNA(Ile2) C34 agmatinyltransferase TiaS